MGIRSLEKLLKYKEIHIALFSIESNPIGFHRFKKRRSVSSFISIGFAIGFEEIEVYPGGARNKSLLNSPSQSEFDFIIPNHRYLFKHSFDRHPDQFWTEIIAYQIGCMMEIPVPPTFVAFDSDNNVCSALIEWFVGYPGQPEDRFFAGGDIMVSIIHGFDRKKGRQHNFSSIEKHFLL